MLSVFAWPCTKCELCKIFGNKLDINSWSAAWCIDCVLNVFVMTMMFRMRVITATRLSVNSPHSQCKPRTATLLRKSTAFLKFICSVHTNLEKCYNIFPVHCSLFTICGDACPLSCVNAEACLTGWPNAWDRRSGELVNAALLSLINEACVNVCCTTLLSSELVGPACVQTRSSNPRGRACGPSGKGSGEERSAHSGQRFFNSSFLKQNNNNNNNNSEFI